MLDLALIRHADHCQVHNAAAPLILVGDAVHNFIDGAVIAAATFVSVPLGVTTAVAVATHEIPQEVGDFAILLGAGYSRLRALWLNVLSGVSASFSVIPVLMQQVRLQGILVGSREGFEALNRAIAAHELRPVIDRVLPFGETVEAFRTMERAEHFGKLCIAVR